MTDHPTLKTGIVGLGNIGQYHAERIVDLGVSLVGGMDVSAEARRRFTRRYDVDVYDDHHELFEEIDAVVVTTPNKFHEQYAVDALERGLHVLLEKPLAHTLESAQRIATAAEKADSYCVVGFNNRFANTVQIVKNRIDREDLGDVTHLEANYVRRRGVPGRGSWFTRRAIAGGGSLIDLGVHAIDLSLYLLDYPPVVEVNGVTRTEFGIRDDYAFLDMWGVDSGAESFDVDDSASAFIRCADNRTISLEVAWATNRPEDNEFVVRGTEAAARFDLLGGDLTFYRASKVGPDHLEDTSVTTVQNDTHTAEQRAFFQLVAADGRFDPVTESAVTQASLEASVEQALTVQRVIDGIYRSSEQGHGISLETGSESGPGPDSE